MTEVFSKKEIELYEELSKKLNGYIFMERDGVKMEFWGPYYNHYGPWEALDPDDPEIERLRKELEALA